MSSSRFMTVTVGVCGLGRLAGRFAFGDDAAVVGERSRLFSGVSGSTRGTAARGLGTAAVPIIVIAGMSGEFPRTSRRPGKVFEVLLPPGVRGEVAIARAGKGGVKEAFLTGSVGTEPAPLP